MYERHELGKNGEEIAMKFLQKQGYKILQKNYSCYFGEADLIVSRNEEIVFVEVKTRAQKIYGTPAEAVNQTKMKHMYKVAEHFIMKSNLEKNFIRFDVIEIFLNERGKYEINQIKNAITERP